MYDAISFGGSSNKYAGEFFRRESRYIDAHLRYVGDEFFAHRGEPNGTAVGRLEAEGPEGFAKVCGQQFIMTVGFGMKFDGQISFDVQINEKTKGNQTEVSLGIQDLLALSVESKEKFAELSKFASIETHIDGATGQAPTPDRFLEVVRTLGRGEVFNSSNQIVIIKTAPYSELAYKAFRDFQNTAEAAAGTLQQFVWGRVQARQDLTDLHMALQHSDFYTAAPTDIQKSADEIEDYLNQLGDLWTVCNAALSDESITKCKKAAEAVPKRPVPVALILHKQQ
ncbi:hypothetical protein NKH56_32825 [Mesorhizobium sp. M1076]|uniref:hypothetical protein n=1 Tax=Mesorhizobium sp. M1076 TaxID=2957054 RepID=UPI0033379F47